MFTLWIVEFFERFAFYGMHKILMLHLMVHRGMDESTATPFVDSFYGLMYLATIPGGILADRRIGQKRALLIGTALLAVGYSLLFLYAGITFYAPLLLLIAGHALFKPAMPAVLSTGYPRLDPGREVAFIGLFLAIQLGSGLAPLAARLAETNLGWIGRFAIPAVAMLLAVLILFSQRRRLPQVAPLPERLARRSTLFIVYLIFVLHSIAAASFSDSVPLFTRDHVDLTLGGYFESPDAAAWLSGSEVAFQVVLAPLAIGVLIYLQRRHIYVSLLAKVGIGMVLMVLPCLLMAGAAMAAEHGVRVSMFWILGAYLAAALPNLLLLPLVLVVIGQLVPRRSLGTVFALWYLAIPVSSRVASALGPLHSNMSEHLWYGMLGVLALCATGLWLSQVRRLEAALRLD